MTRRQAAELAVLGRGCPATPGRAGLALTAQAVPPFGERAAWALTLSCRRERGGKFGMEQGASPF
jgi:hypothetical protein